MRRFTFRCPCGHYTTRSWVNESQATNACDVCGQAMRLIGVDQVVLQRLPSSAVRRLEKKLFGSRLEDGRPRRVDLILRLRDVVDTKGPS